LENQVIYRDFKTSGILLDSVKLHGPSSSRLDEVIFNHVRLLTIAFALCGQDFTAKLSDFGLAVEGPPAGTSYVTTAVVAAPEYLMMTGRLTAKSDVYGFGVVLLELLTGLAAYNPFRPAHEQNLVEWARPYLSGRGMLTRLMDQRLGGHYPPKAALQTAKLAGKCLAGHPRSRPSMADVVAALEGVEAKQAPNRGAKMGSRYLPPWHIARRSSPYNDSSSNLSKPPR
jgi:serine/threonine protein kinase